jgi:hypothetical protein
MHDINCNTVEADILWSTYLYKHDVMTACVP